MKNKKKHGTKKNKTKRTRKNQVLWGFVGLEWNWEKNDIVREHWPELQVF